MTDDGTLPDRLRNMVRNPNAIGTHSAACWQWHDDCALLLAADRVAERDADVSAGAVARTVAMSHIAAERDAERAARERAEAEARQLREAVMEAATELGLAHEPEWASPAAKEKGLNPVWCAICGSADGSWPCTSRMVLDDLLAAVAEGAEHAETAQRQMKGDPTSKTSDEINAQRDAGWPDLGELEWYAITSGIGIVCPSCFMALDGDGLIYELRRWTPSAGPAASVAEGAEDRGQTDG